MTNHHPPLLVIEYIDPLEKFKGWLAIDQLKSNLCAGGMRVQPGLNREHVINMARNMTMKMRVCGLPIGGAKCGIAYDPYGTGKKAAMSRFMSAIKPYIETCYSMGPDLNTTMDELEDIASQIGLNSVKTAIAQAQGMTIEQFNNRYSILQEQALPGWSLGKIRAGYGVAMAALATLRHLNIAASNATLAVQGFGSLAKAAMAGLNKVGVSVRTISDAKQCLACEIDDKNSFQELISTPGTLLPEKCNSPALAKSNEHNILYSECDILLLAAIENVITKHNAPKIRAKAVVPGANLAVSPEAEEILFKRNIIVLPSFMAGCGGSLSMNGLFGPKHFPKPNEVLTYIEKAMDFMVKRVLKTSNEKNISPTRTAFEYYMDETPNRDQPYSLTK